MSKANKILIYCINTNYASCQKYSGDKLFFLFRFYSTDNIENKNVWYLWFQLGKSLNKLEQHAKSEEAFDVSFNLYPHSRSLAHLD